MTVRAGVLSSPGCSPPDGCHLIITLLPRPQSSPPMCRSFLFLPSRRRGEGLPRCMFVERRPCTQKASRSRQSWMRRSKQKTPPPLWENMEQQNHRQEAVLNLNESQQSVSANGKENVRCAVSTKDMCQSLSIAYRHFHPSPRLRCSHAVEIQIPTTHLIFPQYVLCDLFRSH